jgi:hypothetical protein
MRRQIPPGPISGDLEPVLHPQMAAQRLPAKSTLEADDILGLHRSPDRHRRLRPDVHGQYATPETGERSMHRED